MNVLIAVDSFKDALSAADACRAIAKGLGQKPGVDAAEFPLSDGGEGALDVVTRHLGLTPIALEVAGPDGRPVQAEYGLSADGALAFIELARASGLQLLAPERRDARRTTTFGTGQLIADALGRGVQQILMAIGGSATTDAGVGAVAALGWKFLDRKGLTVAPMGGTLRQIAQIVSGPPVKARIEVLCDVANPLFGPDGAAFVYGPQKGADKTAVRALDAGLRHISELAARELGLDGLAEMPGAGAAGGFGFGAMAFLGAKLTRGAERIMDLCPFDDALQRSDIVITGEGRLDRQTSHGKLIAALTARAAKAGKPVIALCGRIEASEEDIAKLGLAGAISINRKRGPRAQLLAQTAVNLEATAASLPLDAFLRAAQSGRGR